MKKEELALALLRYGQHDWACRSKEDPHCPHSIADDRVACHEYPCTCGLASILQELIPAIIYQRPDPVTVEAERLAEAAAPYTLVARARCFSPGCPWRDCLEHCTHGPCRATNCLDRGTSHMAPHRIKKEAEVAATT